MQTSKTLVSNTHFFSLFTGVKDGVFSSSLAANISFCVRLCTLNLLGTHGKLSTHCEPLSHGGPHINGGPHIHGGPHTHGKPQTISAIQIVLHRTIEFDAGLTRLFPLVFFFAFTESSALRVPGEAKIVSKNN